MAGNNTAIGCWRRRSRPREKLWEHPAHWPFGVTRVSPAGIFISASHTRFLERFPSTTGLHYPGPPDDPTPHRRREESSLPASTRSMRGAREFLCRRRSAPCIVTQLHCAMPARPRPPGLAQHRVNQEPEV